MERISTQQEILLATGSAFFEQQCFERSESNSNKTLSQKEQMEEACWNGLLPDLLPGIVEKNADGKYLLLWNIAHHNAFMEIDLCDEPTANDGYYSINPYVFLQHSFEN